MLHVHAWLFLSQNFPSGSVKKHNNNNKKNNQQQQKHQKTKPQTFELSLKRFLHQRWQEAANPGQKFIDFNDYFCSCTKEILCL